MRDKLINTAIAFVIALLLLVGANYAGVGTKTLLVVIEEVLSITTEEQAEVAAMDALWSEVKRLRTVSDQLEAINPPPQDFADDKYWTA